MTLKILLLSYFTFLPPFIHHVVGFTCENDDIGQGPAVSQACLQSTAPFSGRPASESLLQRGLSADFWSQARNLKQSVQPTENHLGFAASLSQLAFTPIRSSDSLISGPDVPEDNDFAMDVMQAATLASNTQGIGAQLVWTAPADHDAPSHQNSGSSSVDVLRHAAMMAAVQASASITALGFTTPLIAVTESTSAGTQDVDKRHQSKVALASSMKVESQGTGTLLLLIVASVLLLLLFGVITSVVALHDNGKSGDALLAAADDKSASPTADERHPGQHMRPRGMGAGTPTAARPPQNFQSQPVSMARNLVSGASFPRPNSPIERQVNPNMHSLPPSLPPTPVHSPRHLCPGLVVPKDTECLLTVHTVLGARASVMPGGRKAASFTGDQNLRFDILDPHGQRVLCTEVSAQAPSLDPFVWIRALPPPNFRPTVDHPIPVGISLAYCRITPGTGGQAEHNSARTALSVDICNANDDLYGRLRKDRSRSVWTLNGCRIFSFEGLFTENTVLIKNELGDTIADTEPCTMDTDPIGKYYRLRAGSGIDVGLLLCCLLSMDVMENL